MLLFKFYILIYDVLPLEDIIFLFLSIDEIHNLLAYI